MEYRGICRCTAKKCGRNRYSETCFTGGINGVCFSGLPPKDVEGIPSCSLGITIIKEK
jgi:hypothetical protein